MKKIILITTLLLTLAGFTAKANSLIVINNTNCPYLISTQGGFINVLPNWIQTYDCPAKVDNLMNNCPTPMYPDIFESAKVVYGGSIQVNVGTAGPTTATSPVGTPCNNNNPFTVQWIVNSLRDVKLVIS